MDPVTIRNNQEQSGAIRCNQDEYNHTGLRLLVSRKSYHSCQVSRADRDRHGDAASVAAFVHDCISTDSQAIQLSLNKFFPACNIISESIGTFEK